MDLDDETWHLVKSTPRVTGFVGGKRPVAIPEEEVEIIMQVGDVYHGLGTAKKDVIVADKNGGFEVSSGIPVKTPPGTYNIEAIGNKGSKGLFNITVVK